MKHLFRMLAYIALLGFSKAYATSEASQTFTFDGRLYSDATGTTAMNDSNVTIKVQILDPSQACVLYEETQSGIDTTASNGYFTIQVGSATGSAKRTGLDSGFAMFNVYSNFGAALVGRAVSNGAPCTYTRTAGDNRYIRMVVTPSATGVANVLSPNMLLDSVPSAIVAENVSGIVSIENGGTGATTTAGVVTNLGLGPLATLSPTGTADASTYLRGDGSWASLSSAATTTASSANTPSTLVLRDGSGDFAAGTITANLNGNATTATSAVSATTATSATNFTGNLVGDVSGTQGANQVDKIQGKTINSTAVTGGILKWDAATTSWKGVAFPSCAVNETAYYNAVGDSITCQAIGLNWSQITAGVPTTLAGYGITDAVQNAGGTPSLSTGTSAVRLGIASPTAGQVFFETDTQKVYQYNSGSWMLMASSQGSGGTVTSVGLSLPSEFSISNSPVTGSGTLTGAWTSQTANYVFAAPNGSNGAPSFRPFVADDISAGTIPVARGGTGVSSLAADGVVLGNGTNAVNVTAAGSADQVLRVPGAGGSPAFGSIDLSKAAAVSGTLPISRGGTGATSFTANKIVGTGPTGTAYQDFSCALDKVISFDATGAATCADVSTLTAGIDFQNGGNSFGGAATLGTNDNNTLAFKTNNINRVTINTDGQVGIGVDTPLARLHVIDQSVGDYTIIAEDYTANVQGAKVKFHKSRGTVAVPTPVVSGDMLGGLDFYGRGITLSEEAASIDVEATENFTDTNHGAAMIFNTATTGSTLPDERMRIDGNGYVGINNPAPGAQLDVKGTLRLSGATSGYVGLAPATNAGNVTYTLPSADGTAGQVLSTNGSGTLAWSNGGAGATQWTTSGSDIYFNTGNVGIGTATPASKLHVSGGIQFADDAAACDNTKSGTMKYDGSLHFCNGSNWQTLGVAGAGLNSLNGQTGTSQTFAVPGTAGTAPNWNSASNVHTLNIPMASTATVTAGLISKTDYDNFNSKLGTATAFGGAGGDISGTYNSLTVNKVQGTPVTIAALTNGNFVKYNGSAWVNSNIDAADIKTGTLPVGRGGTGATTLASNGVLLGNGTSAISATIAGTANQVLRVPSGGGAPAFGAIDLSASNVTVANALTVANGGTGVSSITPDRMIISNGTGTALQGFSCPQNQVLSFNATGVPTCQNVSTIFNSAFVNGGNSFGAAATLGTNDNNTLGFKTNNTTKMTIDTAGNVGIGTASPGAKLTISDSQLPTLVLTETTGGTSSIISTAYAGGAYITGASAGDMILRNASGISLSANGGTSANLRINSSGNVGIGTTSPQSKLDVVGTSTEMIRLTGNAGAGGSVSYSVDSGTRAWQMGAKGTNENGAFFVYDATAAARRLTIDSAGNMGIGTLTPSANLEVSTPDNNTKINVVNSQSTANRWPGIDIINYGFGTNGQGHPALSLSSANGTQAVPSATSSGQSLGAIIGNGYNGTSFVNGARIIMRAENTFNSTDNPTDIEFRTGYTGSNGTHAERMRISSAGNVGIGTTSPTAVLHLKAGTTAANTAPLKFTAGTLLTTAEDGAFEYDGTNYYLTSGSTRRTIASISSGSVQGNVSQISNSSGSITLSPMAGNSVIANSGTTSTSTTSGALIVTGGAGISENLNVGGNIASNGSISAAAATAATSGANVNSSSIYLTANYWNGAASALDKWSITNVLGAGANPTSTLTFAHPSGTTGTTQYSFMNGNVGVGTASPSSKLTVANTHSSAMGTEEIDNYTNSIFGIADTGFKEALSSRAHATHTGGTITNMASMSGVSTADGVGGAVTNQIAYFARNDVTTGAIVDSTFGLMVNDGVGSGGPTNQYGVYVKALTKGTNNFAILTAGTTPSSFGGNVGIGTTNPTSLLQIGDATGNANALLVFGKTSTTLEGNLPYISHSSITTPGTTNDLQIAAHSTSGGVYIATGNGTPTNRLVVTSSGNVGVGTLTPSQKFTVAGGSIITDTNLGFSAASGISVSNGIYAPVGNTLGFITGGSEVMRISNAGNVGIGTTNPIAPLQVAGTGRNWTTSNIPVSIVVPGQNAIGFEGPGSGVGTRAIYSYNQNLYFSRSAATTLTDTATAVTHDMLINSSGNVGIGTASPNSRFQVNANTTDGSNGILVYSNNPASASPNVEVRGRRNDANSSQTFGGGLALAGLRTDAAPASGKRIGTIYFGSNHTDGTEANLLYSASISGVAEGVFSNSTTMPSALAFYTGSTGQALGTANTTFGTERMRIDNTGNVGIGTSTPGQKLTVAGTIESTSGGVKFPDGTTQTTAATAGGITAVTTATCSTVGNGIGGGCTTPACSAGYFRTGCSFSWSGGAVPTAGVASCTCTNATATGGTCYVYCAK